MQSNQIYFLKHIVVLCERIHAEEVCFCLFKYSQSYNIPLCVLANKILQNENANNSGVNNYVYRKNLKNLFL